LSDPCRIGMPRSLPPEIHESVFSHVSDRQTLAAISLASRTFRATILPRLFETITLFTKKKRWNEPKLLRSRAFRTVAPHVRCVKLAGPGNRLDSGDLVRLRELFAALPDLIEMRALNGLTFKSCEDVLRLFSALPPSTRHLVVESVRCKRGLIPGEEDAHDLVQEIAKEVAKEVGSMSSGLVSVRADTHGWILEWLKATAAESLRTLDYTLPDGLASWEALRHLVDHCKQLTELTIRFNDRWGRSGQQ
jgi:hypothetical protein